MAAEIFTAILALRMVLDSETDADSPDNETTFAAIRVAIESLFLILLGAGVDGTVTTIAETVLTDTANFVDSAHIEHTLLMTSGDAKGNMYTIDSNTVNALTCTGDTMASDGVAIGDTYVILYDIKTNTGHTHDAKNAANIDLADDSVLVNHLGPASVDKTAIGADAVGQSELKITSGAQQVTLTNTGTAYYTPALSGGEYALSLYVTQTNTGASDITFNGYAYPALGTSYVRPKASFTRTGGTTGVGFAKVYYVNSSGELHWVFLLMKSGELVAAWEAPDHPCYGNGVFCDHPFDFPFNGLNDTECEIVLLIPDIEQVEQIKRATIPVDENGDELIFEPTLDFTNVLLDMYEIEESKELDYPDIPCTVALPRIHEGTIVSDWRLYPRHKYNEKTKLYEPTKVKPIKRVIEKPDNVTRLAIKERI